MINYTIDTTRFCAFKGQKSNLARTKVLQAHSASYKSDFERQSPSGAQYTLAHSGTNAQIINVILHTNYLINKCAKQAYTTVVHRNILEIINFSKGGRNAQSIISTH